MKADILTILKKVEERQLSPQEGFQLVNALSMNNENLVTLENKGNEIQSTFRFNTIWQEMPLNSHSKIQVLGNILIFDTNEAIFENISKLTRSREATESQVILVKPANDYKYLGKAIYQINPSSKEDYFALVEDLKLRGHLPQNIIHLWSKGSFNFNNESIKDQSQKSIFSLFFFTQSLLEVKVKEKIRFIYLYNSYNEPQPTFAAISGFAKTVQLESPSFTFKVIENKEPLQQTEKSSHQKCMKIILEELQTDSYDVEVCYQGNTRYIKGLTEINTFSNDYENVTLKEDGIYLITGGSGKLALICAEYISNKVKAKIILVGRSTPDEKLMKKIEALCKSGSQVEYAIADISNSEEVDKLIKETKSRFMAINGIIHCAGVLRDAFLYKKTKEMFEDVLGPKVNGTLNLDIATTEENLDFFVLFSSISSVVGNIGQCDYAYANSFMDNYSLLREQLRQQNKRNGKTISINWPLWEEGGMGLTNKEISTFKLSNQTNGLLPLSTSDGIAIFEEALKGLLPQLIVLKGSKQMVNKVLLLKEAKWKIDNKTAKLEENLKNHVVNKVEALLKNIVSRVIKLPPDKIKVNEPFEKYGIDSVMILKLNGFLEEEFGPLSKTLFFEYRTISELVDYFINNHTDTVRKKYASPNNQEIISSNKSIEVLQDKNIMKVNTPERSRYLDQEVKVKKDLNPNEDIAVIGLSGKYPMANNVEEYWENLKNGQDCITEIPLERWDFRQHYDPDKNKRGKSYSKWGGFIDGVDKFDPLVFNISPREAEVMDPQERLFLTEVWKTMEDAGYTRKDLTNDKVGVFVGVMYGHYQLFGGGEDKEGNKIPLESSFASIANRVSYFFNFRGPSIALDTMCSSSLTTIHMACESIKRGECEVAIAGGVNISIHPNKYTILSRGNFLSSDGRCHSFGDGGDGYVPGEGVGAILLKPLRKAIVDGNHIYGVIKGSSINHGGKTNGYTVPSPNAHAELIKDAITKSGINPRTISYIEAHGTGTHLGDPIEISGLSKAFEGFTNDKQFCSLGSVKSNIGHLESAAGISGITKVLLQMQHKQLVPSLHSDRLNSNIDLSRTPFYIQNKLTCWEQPIIMEEGKAIRYPRRAGVSSFGAGGANAHIILEEYEQLVVTQQVEQPGPHIIVLSARNTETLKANAQQMANFLSNQIKFSQEKNINLNVQLTNITYTLQVGREAMDERLAVVGSNVDELYEKLSKYCQGDGYIEGLYLGNIKRDQDKAEFLREGRAGKEFIKLVIQEGDIKFLSKLWVAGVEIDWKLLYQGLTPKLISMPTYPFQGERYWVKRTLEQESVTNRRVGPLIDGINIGLSLDKGIVFEKVLNKSDLIVGDHRVGNKTIFPGVGYLEMVMEAAIKLNDNAKISLSRVVWLQPLIVAEETEEVRLLINKDKGLKFQIISNYNGESRIHCQGDILVNQEQLEREERVEIEEIKQSCTYKIEKNQLYKEFEKIGLFYGPYFQSLKQVWGNSEEALGALQLPMEFLMELGNFILHPTIMDGALQTAVGINAGLNALTNLPMLPFSVEEVEIFNPIKAVAYAYVRTVGKHRYNIAILDDMGHVCVKFHELVVRPLKDTSQDFLYYSKWIQSSISNNKEQQQIIRDRKILIIHPLETVGLEGLLKQAHQGDEVISIELGSKNQQVSKQIWEIKIDDPLGIENCIKQIEKIDVIYFLGGIDIENRREDYIQALEQMEQRSVLSLFRLVKALSKHGHTKQSIQLKVITNNLHPILPEDKIRPFAAGILGLTKSLAKEYPSIAVTNIDISLDENMAEDQLMALTEILMDKPSNPLGEEVAIRNNKRFRRVIHPIQLPGVMQSPFKSGGVYMILGGAGGIGLELSRYLVETEQAKLVLIGRSELSQEKNEKIKQIQDKGGEILYLQADTTDMESMREALKQAKGRFGKINGVVHSAIVLKDKTIENMDEETFCQVLNPKAKGSVILHKVFEGEQLDFMMFFSSAQSFIGNLGQSNYAAACTFKDVFAQYLSQKGDYPVKIINWGYWGTVGVVATEAYNKRLAHQGIQSIMPEEGMEAVRRILAHQVNQVMPLKVDKQLLAKMGFDLSQQVVCYPTELSPINELALKEASLHSDRIRYSTSPHDNLEKLSQYLLLEAFQSMGVFKVSGEQYRKKELFELLSIVPNYNQLFDALLDILIKARFIIEQDNFIISVNQVEDHVTIGELKNLEERKGNLTLSYPEVAPHLELLWTCVKAYPAILTGRQNYMEVMFPEGSKHLVEGVYKGNNVVDYYNKLVAKVIESCLKSWNNGNSTKQVRILEIGAGTGGTSQFVLDNIREYGLNVQYFYTDISLGFTKYGLEKFGNHYPFVEFKLLDIEKDPEEQGFKSNSFDIIFGSNVLHATKLISNTLNNTKKLLKTNGILLLNEITKIQDFATLTFGLTEGWWLYKDGDIRLKGSPLLSPDKWQQLLKQQGFNQVTVLGLSDNPEDFDQSIIIGASDGIVYHNNKLIIKKETMPPRSLKGSIENNKQRAKTNPTSENVSQSPVSPKDLQRPTIDYIKGVFSQVLKIRISEIDHTSNFEKFGVDSLTVIEIIKCLEKDFGKLSTTLLFEYTTIETLCNYFISEHCSRINELFFSQFNPPRGEIEFRQRNVDEEIEMDLDLKLNEAASKDNVFDYEQYERRNLGDVSEYVDSLSNKEVDYLFNQFFGRSANENNGGIYD